MKNNNIQQIYTREQLEDLVSAIQAMQETRTIMLVCRNESHMVACHEALGNIGYYQIFGRPLPAGVQFCRIIVLGTPYDTPDRVNQQWIDEQLMLRLARGGTIHYL